VPRPVKDYNLNDKQIQLLKLTYKFRFMSAPLLAKFRETDRAVTGSALRTLVEKQYLGRHYDKSYKLQGKGASYFLAARGLRYLRGQPGLNEDVLRAMYKNRSLSRKFINHNLEVAEAYLALRNSYPEIFHMFTKSEQHTFDYFPDPRPDLYLNRIKPSESGHNEYMLDIFTEAPLFIIKKRAAAYMEHYDSGDWEGGSDADYPAVLMVVKDSSMEKQLQEHLASRLDSQGLDGELIIYTTTIKGLLSQEPAIWSDVMEPQELLSLEKKQ
jgi:hypothetical protein